MALITYPLFILNSTIAHREVTIMKIPVSQHRRVPTDFGKTEAAAQARGTGFSVRPAANKIAEKIQSLSAQYSPKNLSAAFHRLAADSAPLRQRITLAANKIAAQLTEALNSIAGIVGDLPSDEPYQSNAPQQNQSGCDHSCEQPEPGKAQTPPKPAAPMPHAPPDNAGHPNYKGSKVSVSALSTTGLVEHLKNNGMTDKDMQALKQDIRDIYGAHGSTALQEQFDKKYSNVFSEKIAENPKKFGLLMGRIKLTSETPPKPAEPMPQAPPAPEAAAPVPQAPPGNTGHPNYKGSLVSMSASPPADLVEHLKKNGMTDKDMQALKQDIRAIWGAHGSTALQEQFDKKYSNVFSGKISEHSKNFGLLMGRIKST